MRHACARESGGEERGGGERVRRGKRRRGRRLCIVGGGGAGRVRVDHRQREGDVLRCGVRGAWWGAVRGDAEGGAVRGAGRRGVRCGARPWRACRRSCAARRRTGRGTAPPRARRAARRAAPRRSEAQRRRKARLRAGGRQVRRARRGCRPPGGRGGAAGALCCASDRVRCVEVHGGCRLVGWAERSCSAVVLPRAPTLSSLCSWPAARQLDDRAPVRRQLRGKVGTGRGGEGGDELQLRRRSLKLGRQRVRRTRPCAVRRRCVGGASEGEAR